MKPEDKDPVIVRTVKPRPAVAGKLAWRFKQAMAEIEAEEAEE